MSAADHVLHSQDLCRMLFNLLLFDAASESFRPSPDRVTQSATACSTLACTCRGARDTARSAAVVSIMRHLRRQLPTGRLLLLMLADSGLSLESAMQRACDANERMNRVVRALQQSTTPLNCCPNQCCLYQRVRRSSKSSVRVSSLAPSRWNMWSARSLRSGRNFWCLCKSDGLTARRLSLVRDNCVVATVNLGAHCAGVRMHAPLSERACILRQCVDPGEQARLLVYEYQGRLATVLLNKVQRDVHGDVGGWGHTSFVQLRSSESELRVLEVWNEPHDCWKSAVFSVNLDTGELENEVNPYYGDGTVEALTTATTHDALILVHILSYRVGHQHVVRLLKRSSNGSGVVHTLPFNEERYRSTLSMKSGSYCVACFDGGMHFLCRQFAGVGVIFTATERGVVSEASTSYAMPPYIIPKIFDLEASNDGSCLLFKINRGGRHALLQLTNDPRASTQSSPMTCLMRCDGTTNRAEFGLPGEIVMHRHTGGALLLSASQESLKAPPRVTGLDAPDNDACPYR